MILDEFYDLQRGVTAADGGFSTLLRASWRARAWHELPVVVGSTKTARKKAYFPEQGEQGTLVVDGHEIAIFKLSAGLTRDVFGLVQNVKVVVKIEVQALPGSMEMMQIGQFGGRDDWRTNQHELSYIRRDPAAVFTPRVVEQRSGDGGFCYGSFTNTHGQKVPVCCLFMERLAECDLQNLMKIAVEEHNIDEIHCMIQGGIQAIFNAADAGISFRDMRLDNVGLNTRGQVVICDLGHAKEVTCSLVRMSLSTFLESVQEALRLGGGRLVISENWRSHWTGTALRQELITATCTFDSDVYSMAAPTRSPAPLAARPQKRPRRRH